MKPAPWRNIANLLLLAAFCWLEFGGAIALVSGPLSVMIVEETSERDKLTPGQLDVISSNASDGMRAYLKTHGEKDPLRVLDKDDSMAQDDPKWQSAFAAKGPTVPWLVIVRSGKVLLSEALPAKADETMATLKRFGGN